jgi:hypothetical protein
MFRKRRVNAEDKAFRVKHGRGSSIVDYQLGDGEVDGPIGMNGLGGIVAASFSDRGSQGRKMMYSSNQEDQ